MKHKNTIFALTAATLFAGCDFDIVKDSGFDMWCGDNLCHWKTEEGSIRRVPTWHPKDFGVELVGGPVVLSQNIQNTGACLRVRIIADIQAEAQMALEFDFFDDGIIDHSESIPGVRWRKQEVIIKLPERPYGEVRLILHKKGRGRAVFAEMSAEASGACYGDPIDVAQRGFGVLCARNDECVSGICAGTREDALSFGICSECASATDCSEGAVCGGTETEDGHYYQACTELGTDELGALCATPEECVSGICSPLPLFPLESGLPRCSECFRDSECEVGFVCGTNGDPEYRTCVPEASRQEGEACVSHAECATSNCCLNRCTPEGEQCSLFAGFDQ